MPLQPYRPFPQMDPGNMGIGLVQNIQKAQNNQKRNTLIDIQLQNAPYAIERQKVLQGKKDTKDTKEQVQHELTELGRIIAIII